MSQPINTSHISEIKQLIANNLKTNEPLERHTTFRLPAIASVFLSASSLEKELIPLLDFIKRNDLKHLILGGGSNIIFSKNIYDGIVIKLEGDFKKISRIDATTIFAGAGVLLPIAEAFATREGLSGFETLSGIPGSVGGALLINAGTKYGSISNIVSEVTILDENLSIQTLKREEIEFSYRKSSLKKYPVILSATFTLEKSNPPDILKKIDSIMKERFRTQPHLPSAGCIFKNPPPPDPPAGKLIESCNLKGYTRGGAAISDQHANFIVNKGGATHEDVLYLIELARQKVFEKHNINLELEVEIIK